MHDRAEHRSARRREQRLRVLLPDAKHLRRNAHVGWVEQFVSDELDVAIFGQLQSGRDLALGFLTADVARRDESEARPAPDSSKAFETLSTISLAGLDLAQ